MKSRSGQRVVNHKDVFHNRHILRYLNVIFTFNFFIYMGVAVIYPFFFPPENCLDVPLDYDIPYYIYMVLAFML
jgi:hypothetical protein